MNKMDAKIKLICEEAIAEYKNLVKEGAKASIIERERNRAELAEEVLEILQGGSK